MQRQLWAAASLCTLRSARSLARSRLDDRTAVPGPRPDRVGLLWAGWPVSLGGLGPGSSAKGPVPESVRQRHAYLRADCCHAAGSALCCCITAWSSCKRDAVPEWELFCHPL